MLPIEVSTLNKNAITDRAIRLDDIRTVELSARYCHSDTATCGEEEGPSLREVSITVCAGMMEQQRLPGANQFV